MYCSPVNINNILYTHFIFLILTTVHFKKLHESTIKKNLLKLNLSLIILIHNNSTSFPKLNTLYLSTFTTYLVLIYFPQMSMTVFYDQVYHDMTKLTHPHPLSQLTFQLAQIWHLIGWWKFFFFFFNFDLIYPHILSGKW